MQKLFTPIAVICLTVIILGGCGYISYVRDPFVDIPQFYQVDSRLYRGGKPTEEGIRLLKETGITTVISLQGPSKERNREEVLVESSGMNFISIPMSVYRRPSDEAVMKFMETVLNPENQPVFVHCAGGRDRTGTLVAVYRVLVYGWGPKQAYEEAKKYGFWPYKGEEVLKNFIHQLKDKRAYFTRTEELLEMYE